MLLDVETPNPVSSKQQIKYQEGQLEVVRHAEDGIESYLSCVLLDMQIFKSRHTG